MQNQGCLHRGLKCSFGGLALAFLALGAAADPVRLAVQFQPAKGLEEASLEGTLRVASFDPETGFEIEGPLVGVRIPGEITIPLPSRTTSRLELDGKGFWGPERRFVVATDEVSHLRWRVRPRARLSGRFRLPELGGLPSSVSVTLRPPASSANRGGAQEELILDCPLEVSGQWSCEIPAGRFDVRLAVHGFAPLYLWNRELAGQVLLEPARLVPGASIAGWIEAADGSALEETWVEVLGVQGGADPIEPSYFHPDRRQAFVQVRGLDPGSYRIAPRHDGFAAVPGVRVPVVEGRESRLLEPLILERPADFELYTEPELDPDGRPWQVRLVHESGTAFEGLHGGQIWNRHWHQHDVPEGAYELRIFSSRWEEWLRESIEVKAGDPPTVIELTRVPVRGTITLGEAPVAAALLFGGRRGVRLEADDSGYFEGELPREGEWKVAVALPGSDPEIIPVPPVEVDPPPGGVAEVAIELDGTWIHGEVVDENGEAVADAEVNATDFARGIWRRIRTDAEGSFTFRALPNGAQVMLTAEGGAEAFSEGVRVRVEREAPPKVTLVLSEMRQLTGQVFSAAGSVPRAVVQVIPELPRGMGGHLSSTRQITGAAGEFRFSSPKQALSLDVRVEAPGYAARLFNVPVPADGVLMVPVDRPSGTLELRWSDANEPPRLASRSLRYGAELADFESWIVRHQGLLGATSRVIPAMEPGFYRLCGPARSRCVEGYLPPFGRLSLDLSTP